MRLPRIFIVSGYSKVVWTYILHHCITFLWCRLHMETSKNILQTENACVSNIWDTFKVFTYPSKWWDSGLTIMSMAMGAWNYASNNAHCKHLWKYELLEPHLNPAWWCDRIPTPNKSNGIISTQLSCSIFLLWYILPLWYVLLLGNTAL